MTSPSPSAESPARVVLAGVRGFGEVHAANIARLASEGLVRLVAAVDPAAAAEQPTVYGVDLYADLPAALEAVGPVAVVVIAAPIGAHFGLAETALTLGADVLLEKPPVASLGDFRRLLEIERQTRRVVQVGFQSLGSAALDLLRNDEYGLGPVTSVGAVGAWARTVGYWERSAWAGRRSLDGLPVNDGAATNALAHAVVTALAVAGCRTEDDVAAVETDLYRANAIDCDDTSVVRIITIDGRTVTCALTLCAAEQSAPLVHIYGVSGGQAILAYTADRLEVEGVREPQTVTTTRRDLLENLVAFRRDGTPLMVPLVSTGAFMRVLDAVAHAEEPVRIDPRAIDWCGEGSERRPVVKDVEHWLEEAAASGKTFVELGVPWAHRERDRVLARPQVDGAEVAAYRDGRGTLPTSSPRPYLHPVRTRSGVVVSAQHPADHDWHLGVGVAIPDVNGSSFWGGGTYIHGQGYVLLDNHGTIVGEAPDVDDQELRQLLSWIGRDGTVVLTERRSIGWRALDAESWRLSFATDLEAEVEAVLESPGSKGRPDGGYGGFFWRLPACTNVDVFTAEACGEAAVQGSVAPWLAWSADFAAGPGQSGPATLVFLAPQAAAAGEPWFVRVSGYPGVGSALAWERRLVLPVGDVWARRFEVAVVDGRIDAERAAALAADLASRSERRVGAGSVFP